MKKCIAYPSICCLLSLLLATAFFTTSCSHNDKETKKATSLVIGVSQDYRATDVFSHKGFNCLVFQTLVKADATGKIQPLLAESWEINKEGTSYIFHLQKKAVFSDGTPVTAQQVKESMLYKHTKVRKRGPSRNKETNPAARPKTNRPAPPDGEEKLNRAYSTFDNKRYNLPNWYAFQSIDVLDDHTVRFNLARPYTLFLTELATTHMYPVMKVDINEEVTGYIGTGPYKIDEQKRTQYMTLTRNEHFWQGKVNIDTIRLKVIPDAEMRAIALEAGEIHLTGYDHFDKIPNESVLRLKNLSAITTHQMSATEQPSVSFLTLNYNKPPFTDQKVRQAIALAINRASIDTVMSETGRAIPGPFPQDHADYNPAITAHTFDPDRAKQLLAEAGWSDQNGDGLLEKGDNTLSVELCFNSFDSQYKTVAEIIQAQLKEVGIEVTLQMMELGAHITTMRKAAYDMAFWPMMRYHMFFYTGHPSWLNVYNSPELDNAFSQYLHDKDQQTIQRAHAQTQEFIMNSQTFPLFLERFDVVAWNHECLHNFDPQPLGWDLSMKLWNATFECN